MSRFTILAFSAALFALASTMGCAAPTDGPEDESEQSEPAPATIPANAATIPANAAITDPLRSPIVLLT